MSEKGRFIGAALIGGVLAAGGIYWSSKDPYQPVSSDFLIHVAQQQSQTILPIPPPLDMTPVARTDRGASPLPSRSVPVTERQARVDEVGREIATYLGNYLKLLTPSLADGIRPEHTTFAGNNYWDYLNQGEVTPEKNNDFIEIHESSSIEKGQASNTVLAIDPKRFLQEHPEFAKEMNDVFPYGSKVLVTISKDTFFVTHMGPDVGGKEFREALDMDRAGEYVEKLFSDRVTRIKPINDPSAESINTRRFEGIENGTHVFIYITGRGDFGIHYAFHED